MRSPKVIGKFKLISIKIPVNVFISVEYRTITAVN